MTFRLQADGKYQQVEVSGALDGLAIALVSQTLEKLNQGIPNDTAAQWFAQHLQTLEIQ